MAAFMLFSRRASLCASSSFHPFDPWMYVFRGLARFFRLLSAAAADLTTSPRICRAHPQGQYPFLSLSVLLLCGCSRDW